MVPDLNKLERGLEDAKKRVLEAETKLTEGRRKALEAIRTVKCPECEEPIQAPMLPSEPGYMKGFTFDAQTGKKEDAEIAPTKVSGIVDCVRCQRRLEVRITRSGMDEFDPESYQIEVVTLGWAFEDKPTIQLTDDELEKLTLQAEERAQSGHPHDKANLQSLLNERIRRMDSQRSQRVESKLDKLLTKILGE
jgi:uncharacterized protein YlaI